MSSFGAILRSLRKTANMTQAELADALHISPSAVSSYEQNERFPSPEILIGIADIFHVSIDFLLGREQRCRVLYVSNLKAEDFELLYTIINFLENNNKEGGKMLLT